jgi:F1F0 ATPase subunit 2
MQTVVTIAIGVVVGVVVGVVHFGGLAWTVRRFVDGRHAGVLAASFLVRMAVTALAVVAIAVWAPTAVFGFVPGLLAARLVLTRQARLGVPVAADSLGGARDG